MRRFIFGFALGCACLAAHPFAAIAQENTNSASAVVYPEPPEFIQERINNGRFDLGDFEYLRGYFPEASEAEKARYAQTSKWLERCSDLGRVRLDTKLAELDVTLPEGHSFGTPNICGQVIDGEQFEEFASFAELLKASRGARLVFDTLVQTIARVERGVFSSGEDLGAELQRHTMVDQMLRSAFYWGWSETNWNS